ncbi:unnamed protein product [Acanthocheilonema viteae]|uniref:Uncharacterized protein n=1 Tax=Acanthocheilonema viteae TaxID=6277 RepID=A0A498SRU8_ACAVI|nr:unnamed protein product [Acanthocheilonema viteae]
MQPSNDSAYGSYNIYGRSTEPVQTDRNSNIEFYGTNRPSIYGQEQQLQPVYVGNLRKQQQSRSKESWSHRYREPEGNYGRRYAGYSDEIGQQKTTKTRKTTLTSQKTQTSET